MLSRLKGIDTMLTLLMAIIGATVYVLTSFATVEYVDKRNTEVREDFKEDLKHIRDSLKRIEDYIIKNGGK